MARLTDDQLAEIERDVAVVEEGWTGPERFRLVNSAPAMLAEIRALKAENAALKKAQEPYFPDETW